MNEVKKQNGMFYGRILFSMAINLGRVYMKHRFCLLMTIYLIFHFYDSVICFISVIAKLSSIWMSKILITFCYCKWDIITAIMISCICYAHNSYLVTDFGCPIKFHFARKSNAIKVFNKAKYFYATFYCCFRLEPQHKKNKHSYINNLIQMSKVLLINLAICFL